MSWSADRPYNKLPEIPPDASLESVTILKALIPAHAALSGLNEALVSLPNPAVFVNSLALLEAQASSEIENIVTTTDELFQANSDRAGATAATREALRYKTALFAGQEVMGERSGLITAPLASEICTHIRGKQTEIRHGEGTYIGNPATGARVYTPPVGRDVIESKLRNWEEFVNSSSNLDPLVRLAVAHYQFEAIHPFDDGNGRTGRILNVLMLLAAGLLNEPILYVSQYIIQRKNEYYRLLKDVTERGAWDEWVVYMTEAVHATARSTLQKIKAVQALQADVVDNLSREAGGQYPAGLVDVLFEQPYCRVKDVTDRCGISRPTATKYLSALVEREYLEARRVGREKLYVNIGLMTILQGV